MPTPFHNTFCGEISREILRQLFQFEQNDLSVANFAKDISYLVSSRVCTCNSISHEKKCANREPDSSFGYDKEYYPTVIIEVCYSQILQHASERAQKFILHSNGAVNVVIAFDFDYQKSKKATVSVWRPETITVNGVQQLKVKLVMNAEVHSHMSLI